MEQVSSTTTQGPSECNILMDDQWLDLLENLLNVSTFPELPALFVELSGTSYSNQLTEFQKT